MMLYFIAILLLLNRNCGHSHPLRQSIRMAIHSPVIHSPPISNRDGLKTPNRLLIKSSKESYESGNSLKNQPNPELGLLPAAPFILYPSASKVTPVDQTIEGPAIDRDSVLLMSKEEGNQNGLDQKSVQGQMSTIKSPLSVGEENSDSTPSKKALVSKPLNENGADVDELSSYNNKETDESGHKTIPLDERLILSDEGKGSIPKYALDEIIFVQERRPWGEELRQKKDAALDGWHRIILLDLNADKPTDHVQGFWLRHRKQGLKVLEIEEIIGKTKKDIEILGPEKASSNWEDQLLDREPYVAWHDESGEMLSVQKHDMLRQEALNQWIKRSLKAKNSQNFPDVNAWDGFVNRWRQLGLNYEDLDEIFQKVYQLNSRRVSDDLALKELANNLKNAWNEWNGLLALRGGLEGSLEAEMEIFEHKWRINNLSKDEIAAIFLQSRILEMKKGEMNVVTQLQNQDQVNEIHEAVGDGKLYHGTSMEDSSSLIKQLETTGKENEMLKQRLHELETLHKGEALNTNSHPLYFDPIFPELNHILEKELDEESSAADMNRDADLGSAMLECVDCVGNGDCSLYT